MNNIPNLNNSKDFLAFDYILDQVIHGLLTQIAEPNQSQDNTRKIRRVLSFVYACRIICRISAKDNSVILRLADHICVAVNRQIQVIQTGAYRAPRAVFYLFDPNLNAPLQSPIYGYTRWQSKSPENLTDLNSTIPILSRLHNIALLNSQIPSNLNLNVLLQLTIGFINNESNENPSFIALLNSYLQSNTSPYLIGMSRNSDY